MTNKYPNGWTVEETGGGCQWLRRGLIAITDGDAGLPEYGKPCVIVTLDANGDYDQLMPAIEVASLEKALADIDAINRIYR